MFSGVSLQHIPSAHVSQLGRLHIQHASLAVHGMTQCYAKACDLHGRPVRQPFQEPATAGNSPCGAGCTSVETGIGAAPAGQPSASLLGTRLLSRASTDAGLYGTSAATEVQPTASIDAFLEPTADMGGSSCMIQQSQRRWCSSSSTVYCSSVSVDSVTDLCV